MVSSLSAVSVDTSLFMTTMYLSATRSAFLARRRGAGAERRPTGPARATRADSEDARQRVEKTCILAGPVEYTIRLTERVPDI